MNNAKTMNDQANAAAGDAEAAAERKDYAAEAAFASAMASFHIAQALYQLLDIYCRSYGMEMVEAPARRDN